MKNIKGFSIIAVIVVIAVVIVIALTAFFLKGSGHGDGNNKSDNTKTQQTETVESATRNESENEIKYVEVTVSENKYIFNNKTYEIEEIDSLISDIKSDSENPTVKITDEYAASKAYENLLSALNNEKIKTIEVHL